jgi:RNA polymerase sigma-70 factor (ECF subfamily)
MQLYQPYAYSLAFKLLCNEEDARDCVQESFIRVWKHVRNFKRDHKFKTWLYKIVTNICLDRLRRRKKQHLRQIPLSEVLDVAVFTSDDAEEKLSNLEMASIIERLVDGLSPRQRAVFVLRDLEQLELAEIASVLNLSSTNVKSHLYYARKNIRVLLSKQEIPE